MKITLTPKDGAKYKSDDCGGTVSGNILTISNIKASKSCTVTFTENTYTVSVSSNNISYGTVSVDKSNVEYGGTVKISITPKSTYEYSSDTCGGTRNGNVITISNIKDNLTCVVSFKRILEKCDNVRPLYNGGYVTLEDCQKVCTEEKYWGYYEWNACSNCSKAVCTCGDQCY